MRRSPSRAERSRPSPPRRPPRRRPRPRSLLPSSRARARRNARRGAGSLMGLGVVGVGVGAGFGLSSIGKRDESRSHCVGRRLRRRRRASARRRHPPRQHRDDRDHRRRSGHRGRPRSRAHRTKRRRESGARRQASSSPARGARRWRAHARGGLPVIRIASCVRSRRASSCSPSSAATRSSTTSRASSSGATRAARPRLPRPARPSEHGPTHDAGTTTPDRSSLPCPAGQQRVRRLVRFASDPLYGCGSPSCTPCPSAHGTTGLPGARVRRRECDPGYADCNASATDGCESDLSKATSCGACNAVCAAWRRSALRSARRSSAPTAARPRRPLKCGAECVDPMTSTNHCGGCNIKCADVANATRRAPRRVHLHVQPDVPRVRRQVRRGHRRDRLRCRLHACPVPAGGSATCVAGVCEATCAVGAHVCAGRCVADTDPTACGVACIACPVVVAEPRLASLAMRVDVPVDDARRVQERASRTAMSSPAAPRAPSAPRSRTRPRRARARPARSRAPPGFGNCDANAANGCEATLASDPLNCGACGSACTALQRLRAGRLPAEPEGRRRLRVSDRRSSGRAPCFASNHELRRLRRSADA